MPRRLSDDEISAINERVLGVTAKTKENPWTKKAKKVSVSAPTEPSTSTPIASTGKTNPFTTKARSASASIGTKLSVKQAMKLADKARKKLFAAGWRPAMLEIDVNDEQRELLIKLFVANRELTRARIRYNKHR